MLYVPIGAWEPQGGLWQKRVACTIKRCRWQDWAMETSAEIFWHCLHRGHSLHFPWARWYAIVRLMATAQEWCSNAVQRLLVAATPVSHPKSTVDIFVTLNRDLNVTFDETGRLVIEEANFTLKRGRRAWGEYMHELRVFIKLILARRLVRRRPQEFAGLESGADRVRTLQGIAALESELTL